MSFIKAEQVTAPARFLALTMHFVIVLRVTLDLPVVSRNMTNSQPADYNVLAGFSYAAMACFGIEFITLFMGVSMFKRSITLLNITAHLTGLILVSLFVTHFWNVQSYIALVTVFSIAPLLLELLALLHQTAFSYAGY